MLKKNLIYIIILAAGITAAISASLSNSDSNQSNSTATSTVIVATSTTPVQAKCHVGGCSGEICSDQEGMVSNCMYREAYGCYKSTGAKCERQVTGACGWTETAELVMCIKAADASGSEVVY